MQYTTLSVTGHGHALLIARQQQQTLPCRLVWTACPAELKGPEFLADRRFYAGCCRQSTADLMVFDLWLTGGFVRAAFGSRQCLKGVLGVQSTALLTIWLLCCCLFLDGSMQTTPAALLEGVHVLATGLAPVFGWGSCRKTVFVAVSSFQKHVKPYTALLVADTLRT